MLVGRSGSLVELAGRAWDLDNVELEARGLEIEGAAGLGIRGRGDVQAVAEVLERADITAEVLDDPL